MSTLRFANLAAALVLELVAVFAVGRWGWFLVDGTLGRLVLALLAAAAWTAVWAAFLSPRAAVPLPHPAKTFAQCAMFAVAAVALALSGAAAAAALFGAAVLINRVLLMLWQQDEGLGQPAHG